MTGYHLLIFLLLGSLAPQHVESRNKPIRLMFVCGVHGREYVTSLLCQEIEKRLASVNDSRFEWLVISEVNPDGISLARDQGKPCHRVNGRGVDLNRNWPHIRTKYDSSSSWVPEVKTYEVNPGLRPFSESETRLLRDEIQRWKPNLLMEFHTGECAVLTPYSSTFVPPNNNKEHVKFANWLLYEKLGFESTGCKSGPALSVLYPALGTLMDYAYEVLEVPMVFLVETYRTPNADVRFKPTANMTDQDCEIMFVPPDLEQYISLWGRTADALMELTPKEYHLLKDWTRYVEPGSRFKRAPKQ